MSSKLRQQQPPSSTVAASVMASTSTPDTTDKNSDDDNHSNKHKNNYIDAYLTHFEQPMYDYLFMSVLLVMEATLGYWIIRMVPYTEIDFIAYMEQVTTFVQHSERDYYQIRGTTGPLVYPAGFLYIYTIVQYLSGYTVTVHVDVESGDDHNQRAIRMTQYIFLFLYCCTQLFAWLIYYKSTIQMLQQQQSGSRNDNDNTKRRRQQIWIWRSLLLLLCASKRIHSIYLLRLFNDGITMLFLYMSIYAILLHSTSAKTKTMTNNSNQIMINIGCILFSIAVSIKMNVLLFAPGLLLLLLHISNNLYHCIVRIIVYCGIPQLILGFPFLIRHPIHYVHKAFEFDRVFFYIWTVNWKFLPEDIFVSKPLSILLLLCHVGALIYFCFQWIQSISGRSCGNRTYSQQPRRRVFFINAPNSSSSHDSSMEEQQLQLSPIYITSTMLTCNFIGIVFARTLHYQFYSWYYHAIPFLLFCNDLYDNNHPEMMDKDDTAMKQPQQGNVQRRQLFSYPTMIRIGIILCIEVSFLTFPATPLSSFLLQVSHLLILLQVRPPPYDLFLVNNNKNDIAQLVHNKND